MKAFISQPMRNRYPEEIQAEREEITERLKKEFGDVEVIDSYFKEDYNPMDALGRSISLMSQADIVYFASGWNKARGCKIENKVALEYGNAKYIIECYKDKEKKIELYGEE